LCATVPSLDELPLSPDVTERVNSALEGRYRIERELGSGGMATVYLAHDIKHDRRVALKILKPELAAVIGADRFVQEIRVTANLQHPHILPLHDSGAADTFLYYVMPYVEGETLRDRLDREKQLPVDEAVRIAVAVGNALDYAHRHEIVHRDIKPANILLQDGEPVVADFGIALAVNAAGGARMTETGLSIGTPHYMSPEQASGDRELDGRSDVYALAAMLYEMLTGDPPFQGSTAQAILARILTEKPRNVTQVREATPYHVAAAVERALSKLPADRYASASQFVEARRRADATPPTGVGAAATAEVGSGRPRRGGLALAGAAAVALALGFAGGRASSPEVAHRPIRATLSFTDDAEIIAVGPDQNVGISGWIAPDEQTVVFIGQTRTGSYVYRRPLGSDVAEPIVGTQGVIEVALSPDGSQIVFVANGNVNIVPVTGGVPRQVEGVGYGLHWGADGYLYGTRDPDGVLVRVPVEGGEPEVLAEPDSTYEYYWVQLLPDERTLLASQSIPDWNARALGNAPQQSMIQLVDVETKEVRDLVPGVLPQFAPPDLLVFAGAAGPSYARLDYEAGELIGSAQPFLPGVAGFDASMSPQGHLAFVKGTEGGDQVVLVDANGGERGVVTDLETVGSAKVSPDGTRIAVSQGSPPDLWVYPLSGEAPIRLTFGDGEYAQPAWSSDGSHVYMTSGNGVGSDLYRVRADGLGKVELIRDEDVAVFYPSSTPGGDWLAFYELRNDTQRDILALRQDDPSDVVEVIATPANERSPMLSPDERFLAFVSNTTGIDEVYVTRFPSGEGLWQVSSGGGWEPIWSEDGTRLLFRNADTYKAALVDTQNGFRAIRTTDMFSTDRFSLNNNIHHWGVVWGGEGFVMIRVTRVAPELQIILNLPEQLSAGR
jgi:tRNA A-37 threonylcarbamoyl transferase component Bud32